MAKLTKRQKVIAEKVDNEKLYTLEEAVQILNELPPLKFKESLDIAINLGVDPRKMTVRGVCDLPHGSGKQVRVAVFASGQAAEDAVKAGAERVGLEDLADDIRNDKCPFDVIIAHPETMAMVGTLGKKLGPKGLMPNPKLGTVSQNVAQAVKQAKAGQSTFKLDKAGIIHCGVGRANFTAEQLAGNIRALLESIRKLKPAAAKGQYMQKLYISTTMSRGAVRVDLTKID